MANIPDVNDADRWVVERALTEQYGTGREFDDLAECVVTTLRLQADHEKDRAGATSGKTGADLKQP